jgi:hypothetical protein
MIPSRVLCSLLGVGEIADGNGIRKFSRGCFGYSHELESFLYILMIFVTDDTIEETMAIFTSHEIGTAWRMTSYLDSIRRNLGPSRT